MKTIFCYLFIAILFVGCKAEVDNSVNEAFEANSKTVLANLDGFENENVDYGVYAEDFVLIETMFGAEKDSLNLNELMASDKQNWEMLDFELLTKPTVLLPGVNPETIEPDGSVRHYSAWKVTRPATDSTEAKSGVIQLYESYDFNAEGKIRVQQIYGDFTGILMYLQNDGA
jgi:hypothetical protein